MNRHAAADPPATDGLAPPRRHWALIGLWIGMALSVLDSAIVNIALPSIARDMGAGASATTWVVTGYQIAIVMTLLPVSALGEWIGYRQVYVGGLILFILTSLACAFSGSLEALVLFRWLQGVAAAAMMGVNGALMRFTYPKALLGRGIGYNALVIAGTAAIGPALAALLLSLGRWPILFLINVPSGLLALGLVLAFLPQPAPATRSFDWLGALLSAAMFGGLLLTLSHAIHGLAAWQLLPTAVVGLLAGVWLFRRIGSSPRPMIPVDLIRRPPLRTAYAASICAFAAQMCLLVALPFLLESRLHLDVATIGLLILPLPIGVAIASPLAGRLAEKPWAGRMSAIGLCLQASCLALMGMALRSFPALPVMTLAMGLGGIGFGLFQTPNNHVMLRAAPIGRAGAAAGMLSLSRLLGQGFGTLLAALSLRLAGQSALLPLYLAVFMALCGAGFACRRKYKCS